MMYYHRVLGLALVAVVALTAACGATAGAPALTEDQLKSANYELQDLGLFRLSNGAYEKKYGDGATQVNKAGLMNTAFGKLDKDASSDAAAVLWWSGGGSGTFIYLVAVQNDKGQPKQVAATMLGDRVQIKALTIENNKIVVKMLSFGPTDPRCCPSVEATETYQLDGAALKKL